MIKAVVKKSTVKKSPVKKTKLAKTKKNVAAIKELWVVWVEKEEVVEKGIEFVEEKVEEKVEDTKTQDPYCLTKDELKNFFQYIREKSFYQRLSAAIVIEKIKELTWFEG